MGRKIFVSYKYADSDVEYLIRSYPNRTTVRDYVDLIEEKLGFTDHIYKGESDGEDLSALSDETIWEKLKDRIYDSTLTIVIISPGMRDCARSDRGQWIPWEISYSLKEESRHDSSGNSVKSRANAMLAVVLPDASGSYDYYLRGLSCCSSGCTEHQTGKLFEILRKNKFNRKSAQTETCKSGTKIWDGDACYIKAVKWSSFISNPEKHINEAYARLDDIESYEICKTV